MVHGRSESGLEYGKLGKVHFLIFISCMPRTTKLGNRHPLTIEMDTFGPVTGF